MFIPHGEQCTHTKVIGTIVLSLGKWGAPEGSLMPEDWRTTSITTYWIVV
ncbi:hypothetical protein SynPROS91_01133 [Synechococcus sp. PROS-9-1]|nr:hypothetical protein SynPROS91_01133 [Synechococcus sp. PROS-9-1]